MPLLVSLPDRRLLEEVAAGGPLPGVELVLWTMDGPAPHANLDIVVLPYMDLADRLRLLEGLSPRLVQGQSIGYDDVVGHLPAGLVFANAATVHEASTAELAIGLALASQRGLPRFIAAAGEHRWAPAGRPTLADRRVLLLGYGGVGQAIESRLQGFEVSLTRVASHARDEPSGHVHGVDELPELLPQTEVVLVAIPLTDATRGLVSAEFLAALPDRALVVNVSRGQIADTAAILAESDRLRFALDVTDPEPLPEGHPLWSKPNVLITPHVGGATSAMMPRMARLLRRQIGHALAGEPFENVVLGG